MQVSNFVAVCSVVSEMQYLDKQTDKYCIPPMHQLFILWRVAEQNAEVYILYPIMTKIIWAFLL
jgi:hypothetical protein